MNVPDALHLPHADALHQPPPAGDAGCSIPCRRLERPLPAEDHARCPWCFGPRRAIATGRHELFCDWQRDRDPIHFGFPPDLARHLQG